MDKIQKLKLTLSLIFLMLALLIMNIALQNVYKVYPNPPVLRDFLFEHTPFLNISIASDIIIILSIVLFIVFVFTQKNKYKEIPYYAVIIGVYYLIRSALIYLTPIGNPDGGLGFGLNIGPDGGMFPSGHTGITFLIFLFSLSNQSKKWKITFLTLAILEMISLILSRGHYTIDIVGAVAITYSLYKLSENKIKKFLSLKKN